MLPFLLNPVQHEAVRQGGSGPLRQAPRPELPAFGASHAAPRRVGVGANHLSLRPRAVPALQAAAALVPVLRRRQRRTAGRRRSTGACWRGRSAGCLHHLSQRKSYTLAH